MVPLDPLRVFGQNYFPLRGRGGCPPIPLKSRVQKFYFCIFFIHFSPFFLLYGLLDPCLTLFITKTFFLVRLGNKIRKSLAEFPLRGYGGDGYPLNPLSSFWRVPLDGDVFFSMTIKIKYLREQYVRAKVVSKIADHVNPATKANDNHHQYLDDKVT